jgi:hypothetical protein
MAHILPDSLDSSYLATQNHNNIHNFRDIVS